MAAAAAALIAALLLPGAASGAPGLIAAYEHYVPGQGFDIRLVDAVTGRQINVPTSVNTAADELHPALSPDGRFLWFTRMSLLPQLNGDIPVPAATQVLQLDRQPPGTVAGSGTGAGPVMSVNGNDRWLAWGRPPASAVSQAALSVGFGQLGLFNGTSLVSSTELTTAAFPPLTGVRSTPHAAAVGAVDRNPNTGTLGVRSHVTELTTDPSTGALVSSLARLSFVRMEPGGFAAFSVRSFGAPGTPAGHPVPRTTDGLVALDLANGQDVDIQTVPFAGQQAPTPAPSPITTTDPERMPAWSADGLRIAFVRTTGGHRRLGVFDATPGIQTIVNPLVDLGAEAPTPQTRAFQSAWGGLSLAATSALDAAPTSPVVACDATCVAALTPTRASTTVVLQPTVSLTTKGQLVGIFVVRVTGTRTLFGRRVPRIEPVGRVPLGATRKGRNRFGWDGRVAGRRLTAGTYLLTYRVLRAAKVVSLSGSIRVRIGSRGQVLSARREA